MGFYGYIVTFCWSAAAKAYHAQEKIWAKERQGARTDLDTSVPTGTNVEKSDDLSSRAASRAGIRDMKEECIGTT